MITNHRAVNHAGFQVEQHFPVHGFLPLHTRPHTTLGQAKAEFDRLIGQPFERRVFEALHLHKVEAERIRRARIDVGLEA